MRRAIFFVMLILCLGVAAAAESGWRTDGRGSYPAAEPPTTFSPDENVVWATPLPDWSNASPVVSGNRIFVCAEPDTLICVEKESGRVLWANSNPVAAAAKAAAAAGKARTHPHNGYTSATPVTDGETVFAVFGNGVVAAYDMDGELLWNRFVEKPVHQWGHCASPVLTGGKLLVHIEALLALDPATGKELWRQPAETWTNPRAKKWGTCTPTRIGETLVVVTINGRILRVEDGEVLFRDLPHLVYASPLIVDGVAYFIRQKLAVAVRLPQTLEGKPEKIWEAEAENRRYYSSPALHEGVLYTISQTGLVTAYDAETGEEIFQKKLLMAANERERNAVYSSVTFAGGYLYLAGMDGSIVVLRPGFKYDEVARTKVEKALRSNPVFEGKRMYLRAPGHLYCFGE